MQITLPNIVYAARHPVKTLKYLARRDRISYKTIARYLPSSPVILEAGAANGANTLEMAEFWPSCKIYAFEPVPGARKLLENATKVYSNRVLIFEEALGEASGRFQMWVSGSGGGDSQSSSLLKPSSIGKEYSFVQFKSEIEVSVTTIDEWALQNSVKRLDFLWLDMQGYEISALKGGLGLLKGISAIHMEVNNLPLYEGAPLTDEVMDFMHAEGFYPRIDATFRVGGNILFTR